MVEALRDVKVRMPHAVRKGEKALLKCMYDMEGDSLYAVKWYKKGREFYRYTPKENPAMKVFGMHGFRIDRQASNESQLVLDHVSLSASGKYSCEVSADAPSFHTLIGAGELDVVETPSHKPIITNIRPKYRIGESVRGNCSSRNSKPAANLTWLINDQEVKPGYVKYHKPIKDKNDLETSYAYIQFVVTEDHFQRGKLKIRCRAHIHDIYSQSTEKSIEIERHKHNSVSSGSNTINVVHGYPYDQYSLHDIDNYDKKDTFMTHIQGDVSSLNSGGSSLYSITKLNGGLYHIILVGLLLQLTLLVILILPTYYIEQQQQQQQYKPQKQYKEEGKQEEQFDQYHIGESIQKVLEKVLERSISGRQYVADLMNANFTE
ncbi:uncharacterized protein LOC129614403 [Condylostylus longicornis]|uniref:uncharacterized protein LOC129614403 n=1 Tax=Condylostylus longicornis TaxID=2530218 RepID=UPI00244DE090|nr:uncharacterized protein LOC129614403 [Condylostylus longicornis]